MRNLTQPSYPINRPVELLSRTVKSDYYRLGKIFQVIRRIQARSGVRIQPPRPVRHVRG